MDHMTEQIIMKAVSHVQGEIDSIGKSVRQLQEAAERQSGLLKRIAEALEKKPG